MKHKSLVTFLFVFMSFGLSLFGCGKGAPPGFPEVVPCVVTILKDGVPLPQVTVLLVSEGGKEWFVSGESDTSGITKINTILTSYSKLGAPEGTYKVTLFQVPQVSGGKSQQEIFDMSPAEKAAYKQKMDQLIKESRSFPMEFESHLTTPISLEVAKAESKYTIDVSEWIKK